MTTPYRPKAEYGVIVLVGGLALALGLGAAVARYVTGTPAATPRPTISSRPPADSSPSTPQPSAPSGWIAYADTADDFSLNYPQTWQQRTCSANGHTTLYLAPTTATLGACNSDFGGQMYLGAVGGDQRATYTWAATGGYDAVVTRTVTVDGISALRQTAIVPQSAAAGPVPGTKMVQYLFYKSGRTYVAVYAQSPGAPETLADFDTMITTTLEISPR